MYHVHIGEKDARALRGNNITKQQLSNLFCILLHHFFSQLAQYCLVWLRFCLQLSYTMFFCLLYTNTSNRDFTYL